MRSLPGLYLRMLRYRVAVMVWMFMLLGAASRGGLDRFEWGYVWATLALGSSYVAATALNDIADREIDLINHPRDSGRPLVSGDATERELAILHVLAAALALGCAAPLGWRAVEIVALSLAISFAYSLPPIRLSYRTCLAAPALAVAYVLVPFSLGLEAIGSSLGRRDAPFATALFTLFVARINLKDFRDREGDARYGKRTLLLRFGKDATCAISLAALLAGNVLLLAALDAAPALAVLIELFVATIASMLVWLWRAATPRREQVAIGIGARMGNGLLITVLGWLLLSTRGAPPEHRTIFAAALTSLFAISFAALVSRPDTAVIGYKG